MREPLNFSDVIKYIKFLFYMVSRPIKHILFINTVREKFHKKGGKALPADTGGEFALEVFSSSVYCKKFFLMSGKQKSGDRLGGAVSALLPLNPVLTSSYLPLSPWCPGQS